MAVTVVILLLVSLAIPLILWVAISRETSDPTVVDRREAERIAKERGGREPARSARDRRGSAGDEHTASGGRVSDEDRGRGDRPTGFGPDERDE